MKAIAIFIFLKIVEISAIVFIPWGLGSLARKYGYGDPDMFVWITGIVVLVALAIVFSCIMILIAAIRANWDLAKKLSKSK